MRLSGAADVRAARLRRREVALTKRSLATAPGRQRAPLPIRVPRDSAPEAADRGTRTTASPYFAPRPPERVAVRGIPRRRTRPRPRTGAAADRAPPGAAEKLPRPSPAPASAASVPYGTAPRRGCRYGCQRNCCRPRTRPRSKAAPRRRPRPRCGYPPMPPRCNLVDSASSHTLVSKIKPCMS